MTASVEKMIEEIRDRVVRLESRMVQLGDHVGANLRAKQRITLNRHAAVDGGGVYVEVDSLDVSVSRILTTLKEAHVSHGCIVDVYHNHDLAFTLHLKKD